MSRAIAQALLLVVPAAALAMDDAQPTPEMMVPVEKVVHFVATSDTSDLSAFASHGVVIVENFPPYVFEGPDAVQRWSEGMRAHTGSLDALVHTFGSAQDFSTSGDRVYFSLPTQWTGRSGTQKFVEDGGWSFVLVRENGGWRVLSYGWSVTKLSQVP